jgi:hypothetical protein
MLALAKFKIKNVKKPRYLLDVGDARELLYHEHDVVVCVRFLDLIDEKAMRAVMRSITQKAPVVIFTIRFGKKYTPKSNTAEHDEKKFRALVRELGFVFVEAHPVFAAGWHVCMIRRGK